MDGLLQIDISVLQSALRDALNRREGQVEYALEDEQYLRLDYAIDALQALINLWQGVVQ